MRFESVTGHILGGSIPGPIMDIITWVHINFQLPLSVWTRIVVNHANGSFIVLPVITTVTLVAGIQAWRAFRTPPAGAGAGIRTLGRMFGVVTSVVILALLALRGVANLSPYFLKSPLAEERLAAFQALNLPLSADGRTVSLAELEATGKLSAQTKAWMTNSKLEITFERVMDGNAVPKLERTVVWAREEFPDGEVERIVVDVDEVFLHPRP
jgi:hypothetical protein